MKHVTFTDSFAKAGNECSPDQQNVLLAYAALLEAGFKPTTQLFEGARLAASAIAGRPVFQFSPAFLRALKEIVLIPPGCDEQQAKVLHAYRRLPKSAKKVVRDMAQNGARA